jgi:hypothetical protein
MFRSADRQRGARQPMTESLKCPFPLGLGQSRRGPDIEAQLDFRVRGVHALPAWTRRTRKLLPQLGRWDREAIWSTGTSGDVQILHISSVS